VTRPLPVAIALALPLRTHADARTPCRCGHPSTPCRGIPTYDGDEGAYGATEGAPLCRPCALADWTAYQEARRDRLDLAALARYRPGARMADLRRARATADEHLQAALPWWRA
jgi:hypothetical protein